MKLTNYSIKGKNLLFLKYGLVISFLFLIYSFRVSYCNDNVIARKEICYEILDLEKEAGFSVPDSLYVLLDSILKTAERKIQPKEDYAEKEAIEVLERIVAILEEYGIKTRLHYHGDLLSVGLKEKEFDCGNYVIVYVSIGQRLGLPIYAVSAPRHIFIHFNAGDSCSFFWETLYQEKYRREHYIERHNIPNESLQKNIYLKDLSWNNLIADRLITTAHILNNEGKFEKSIDYYEKSLKINPLSPEAYCGLGSCYMDLRDYDKTLEYLDKSLELNPNFSAAISNEGAVYVSMKKYDKALKYVNKALDLNELEFAAYVNKAKIHSSKEEYEEALESINRAIELDSTDSNLRRQKANILYKMDNYGKAIENYDKSISLDPLDKYSYNNRGLAYANVDSLERAVKDFKEAYRIDTSFKSAALNIAKAYYFLENYEDAIAYFKKTLEIDSSNNSLRKHIGISYKELGSYRESVNWLSKYLKEKPNNEKALRNRAAAFLKLDKCDSALIDYRKIIEDDGEITADYEDFTRALLLCKKFGEATKYIEKGLETDSSNAYLKICRAHSLLLQNKFQQAAETYRSIIATNEESARSSILSDLERFKKSLKGNDKIFEMMLIIKK